MVLVRPCVAGVRDAIGEWSGIWGNVRVSRTCTCSVFVRVSYTGDNPAHIA